MGIGVCVGGWVGGWVGVCSCVGVCMHVGVCGALSVGVWRQGEGGWKEGEGGRGDGDTQRDKLYLSHGMKWPHESLIPWKKFLCQWFSQAMFGWYQ